MTNKELATNPETEVTTEAGEMPAREPLTPGRLRNMEREVGLFLGQPQRGACFGDVVLRHGGRDTRDE